MADDMLLWYNKGIEKQAVHAATNSRRLSNFRGVRAMSIIPPTKQCTKCGETFPATAEHWHKSKGGKFGLRAECKGCGNERTRQHHEANRDRMHEYARKYREVNPDKVRELRRRYYEANGDKEREYQHQYYEANREELREELRERARLWREANPDKVREQARNKRARKRNAEGSHTADEVQGQYDRQKGKCYWCDCKLDKNNYHADHVIPLVKGGSNYISNIVCACPTCNLSKNDKLPHEWDGNGGRLL